MANLDIFRTPSGMLKAINLGLIIITVAIFYSRYSVWYQFVGTTIVSGLAYTFILLLTYTLGGMAIQKTFYELLMNIFFVIMFFSSCIVSFVHGSSGIEVTTGLFCLFSFVFFAVDIYFSLVNMGALSPASGGPPPQATPATSVPPPTININTAGSFPTSVINPSTNHGPPVISPSY